jgi:L-ascorbate metabolism protein UlaG (beta-lactamase superfamily)
MILARRERRVGGTHGADARGAREPRRGGPDAAERLRGLRAAVRSSLRRYPKELMGSFRRLEAHLHHDHLSHPPHSHAGRTARELEELVRREFACAWLGHASVVARVAGVTALVDPVLSHRVGPRVAGRTFGPRRLEPAPVAPEALPVVDLVLITHAHFDHLDRPTLERLRSPRAVVVTPVGVKRLIPRGFSDVVELPIGRTIRVAGVELTALAPAHWGARMLVDRRRGYASYVAEKDGRRVLLAGDTAETDAFDRVGPVDLAVFGIGAYDPWIHMHASPEQVWGMFRRLGGRRLLPVHHSTYKLSDEHPDEPLQRLLAAAGGERERVLALRAGEAWAEEPEG